MPSDREFLHLRLELVQEKLDCPEQEFIYAGDGKVNRRTQPVHKHDTRTRREARLLRKLLAQTNEGQALKALNDWRRQVGRFLMEHRQQYQDMEDAHDAWWRLQPWQKERIPEPPKPPSARLIDCKGAPWIIDERFLTLLEDLIERLQKWLAEDQEKIAGVTGSKTGIGSGLPANHLSSSEKSQENTRSSDQIILPDDLQRVILECIDSFPGKLSRTAVARILVTSPSRRIEKYRNHFLYGKFKHLSRNEVMEQIDYLIELGLISRQQRRLFLSPVGEELKRSPEPRAKAQG